MLREGVQNIGLALAVRKNYRILKIEDASVISEHAVVQMTFKRTLTANSLCLIRVKLTRT